PGRSVTVGPDADAGAALGAHPPSPDDTTSAGHPPHDVNLSSTLLRSDVLQVVHATVAIRAAHPWSGARIPRIAWTIDRSTMATNGERSVKSRGVDPGVRRAGPGGLPGRARVSAQALRTDECDRQHERARSGAQLRARATSARRTGTTSCS